jgi:hypothetical protein
MWLKHTGSSYGRLYFFLIIFVIGTYMVFRQVQLGELNMNTTPRRTIYILKDIYHTKGVKTLFTGKFMIFCSVGKTVRQGQQKNHPGRFFFFLKKLFKYGS